MTSTSDESSRHVSQASVEDYFEQEVDGVISVEGDPPARLIVVPSKGELAIRVPATPTAPELTGFANLTLDFIDDEGLAWHQLSVQLDRNLGEVYDMLCNILDRVQITGSPFKTAVEDVLASMADILARRGGMSEDQQVGLAGELLTFLALVQHSGIDVALEAWTGPLREEHDFGTSDGDLEVKVTLGERRTHWISSVTQLVPTPGRDLYLVSIQLTRAGAGSGWTLPELVNRVVSSAKEKEQLVNAALAATRYRANDADLYAGRWTMRSPPAFFAVDNEFPALSQSALSAIVPSSQRIVEVRYRIDLTGLAPATELFPFFPAGGPDS